MAVWGGVMVMIKNAHIQQSRHIHQDETILTGLLNPT